MLTRTYISVWNKYRPAILRMMIESGKHLQSYQLSNHEFKALGPTRKKDFSFQLSVASGKVTAGLKDSEIAQDLWEMLQYSRTASELIASGAFQFSMDKHFVLHIEKLNE
jgi:hypothetical protein